MIKSLKKYRFLIRQLVGRDFKNRYRRSVLGVFWSFLNPLMTMGVQYIVFSRLFRFDISNYAVYLLCGIVMFNYFSEACDATLNSIVANAPLITKVYVPKYIYPLTKVYSSLINLLASMLPLIIISLISGVRLSWSFLLIPFPIVCIAVFCLGLGMLLATSMVFFQDTRYLWSVMSMLWMYLTPIIYPISILPENLVWIVKMNPLYYFVDFLRTVIIGGASPDPLMYLYCVLWAAGMLAAGSSVFARFQDDFILYL